MQNSIKTNGANKKYLMMPLPNSTCGKHRREINKYSAISTGCQTLFIGRVRGLRDAYADSSTTLVSKGNYIFTDAA